MNKLFSVIVLTAFFVMVAFEAANAARLKDIASIRGVRENQLLGYGIVVGLKGTGDGKNEFMSKSMVRMLDKLGMKLDSPEFASKNVAAVIITGTMPAFGKAGNPIDVTVSAIGDASSLQGGTLLQAPLRAANEQVYAVAQGSIIIGGDGKDQHLTSGRIPNGATIERDMTADFASRKMYRLTLINPDFTTAARSVLTINKELGGHYASAKDSGTIDIITPFAYENRGVELLATIESIEINPDMKARVVVNEKTGTIVIGDKVKISKVAISHGSLSVKVGEGKNAKDEKVAVLESGVSVGELVQALNKLGVSPKDLITILQSIKSAGALHGELEVL
ncbi:flagellar biosynthesis protein FlgA [Bdellovibrio bacteriovorus]|uniref:Flagellar P-ring protein n=1 Tax=Bdellovibrio bacteriovorus TaxID=959 RepID=A0A150WIK8_BDEBC|nr:flagellar basal body P-ring protein FlgI [Bdellovibrio bacteriovorus]KYG63265.1 flagellar biosynthesis protein FlgA [Bdellovibrio bacteriovorus]KYG69380.1 flagellar biosynthesis protein FlgA [Bdellovibrio bacteriovorus]